VKLQNVVLDEAHASMNARTRTVLVDDEEAVRKVVRSILERSGYPVLLSHGAEAVAFSA